MIAVPTVIQYISPPVHRGRPIGLASVTPRTQWPASESLLQGWCTVMTMVPYYLPAHFHLEERDRNPPFRDHVICPTAVVARRARYSAPHS
jgi:hypothetical protein